MNPATIRRSTPPTGGMKLAKPAFSYARGVLLLVGLLLAGAAFAGWLVRRADRQFRADLIRQSQLVAEAVDVTSISSFTGTSADLTNPRYVRLEQQLLLARTLYPQCRFVYIMGRKPDGTIFIHVDSELPSSPDYSPPGEVFTHATPVFRAVFDTAIAVAEGPIADEWGTWMSGLTPLTDPRTGGIVAMLGIDIDSGVWRAELWRAAMPAVLVTAVLASILVAGSVLLARRATRDAMPAGWMRHLELGLVGAVGIILTLTAAWVADIIETRQRYETFERLATSQAATVVERLKNIRNNQLESLARQYMVDEDVTNAEFQLFSESLTSNPVVANWIWMPAVPAAERAAFEASARAEIRPDYQIWEKDAAGRRQPVGEREILYPIAAVAPVTADEALMGYDPSSDPQRRPALDEAMRTGLATATDPIVLLHQSAAQKGMMVYRPVFATGDLHRVRGFVGAAVQLKDLLAGGITNLGPRMEIALLHRDAAPELLASSAEEAGGKFTLRSTPRPFFAFGKVFFVTVNEQEGMAATEPLRAGTLALVIGLVLTGTLLMMVRLTLRQRARLERLVAVQTRDLRARTAFFEALVDSAADGILVVDSGGRKVLQNRRMDEVWKIPPEVSADPDDNQQVLFVTAQTKNPEAFVAKVRHLYSHPNEISRDLIDLVDGSVLERYTAPVLDAQGQYYGRIWSFRDISEQRRTEQALRHSEARYRSIIAVSNTGAWEYHRQTDFLWCSAEYFGMLGRNATDFDLSGASNLSTVWLGLIHPDDRAAAADNFATYLRTGSVGTYEAYFRMQHRSGEWVWIWSRGQTLRDALGNTTNLTVGTHIDITERKRAAIELETAHRNLQERIKEVNCLYHILRLMERSNATLGELLGAAVNLIPPAWRYPRAACARIVCDGKEYLSPGFSRTRWGISTPIAVAGETVGLVEVCYREDEREWHEDPFLREERALVGTLATQFSFMIERKRTEEKLSQLSSIIEQAPLSVVITAPHGAIEYVNPKFCAVTGYAPDEVIGRQTHLLWSEEMSQATREELAATVAANQVWTGEVRSRRKNGETYLENVVVAPLVDERGEVAHYVALKDDITAQKRFEAETTALLQQERKVSEMKSQFISVTSHEFRTPLAAAVGSLELLERHADKMTPAKRGELLARTQRSLARLTEIINQVLNISRVESGRVAVKREPVDLAHFAQDAMREVEVGDRQQHQFEYVQTGGPAVVPADPSLLHHVLSNLLGNAARYSPAGTTIRLSLDLGATEFVLTVADEGIGIPEAEREGIFQAFIRGSNVGQISGTGLGLNIVKRYVELMGGSIKLISSARGATFEVRIPVLPAT